MAKIGIEPALTNVQQALEEKGYEVIPVHNESELKMWIVALYLALI